MAAARGRNMPARVRWYVAAVTCLALLLLPVSRLSGGRSGGLTAAIAAVVFGVLIVGAHWRPVHIGPKRKLNVGTAPELAAVLLLPGPLAALTIVTANVAGEARVRSPLIQRVFNGAIAGVRAAAGTAAYGGLLGRGPSTWSEPAAVLAAPVVMWLITTTLVRGIVSVQQRRNPLRQSWGPQRDELLAEAALSLTGIVTALAAADEPWALPLLIGPAVIAQRAIRDGIALRAETARAAEALDQARAALTVRDEFLSVAAHEFRTPLTTLRVYLQLSLRRLRRHADRREAEQLLEEADAQVERLNRLVGEMTEVSRLVGGRPTVECEPTALRPLVRRVVEARRAMEPGRAIGLTLPDTILLVSADPGRLEQVFANLLENASKYSPPERPIHVSVETAAGTVRVAVCDQGVGIPEEEQARIFDRFHRASNVDRGIAGMGLGLHIAHELVQAHGGTLAVESAWGAGSTFTVTLPQLEVPDATTAGARRPA